MSTEEILNNLHTLVSHNVIGDKQLKSRYKGFRSELQFVEFIRSKYPKYNLLKGGVIISKDSKESSLDNSIYFTTIRNNENISNYLALYKKLSPIFKAMFLIQYDEDVWSDDEVMIFPESTVALPVPKWTMFQFDGIEFSNGSSGLDPLLNSFQSNNPRGKNRYRISDETHKWLVENLAGFSNSALLDVYIERLVFDGYIGFSKKKGKSSDIDLVTVHDGTHRLIEIKEKDLPKIAKKGFGLDVPRLSDFNRIQDESGMKYILIIKHINNQSERNLINWKFITANEFYNNVKNEVEVEGGTGMRSANSSNPTLICDFDLFRNL